MNKTKRDGWLSIAAVLLILLAGSPSLCLAAQAFQDEAEQKFQRFQDEWLVQMRTLTGCSSELVTIEPSIDGAGGYTATYREISPASLIKVKPTGEKGVPFVGTIRYDESFFQSQGSTPEEAKLGSFTCTKIRRITEIFYFHNGRWIK